MIGESTVAPFDHVWAELSFSGLPAYARPVTERYGFPPPSSARMAENVRWGPPPWLLRWDRDDRTVHAELGATSLLNITLSGNLAAAPIGLGWEAAKEGTTRPDLWLRDTDGIAHATLRFLNGSRDHENPSYAHARSLAEGGIPSDVARVAALVHAATGLPAVPHAYYSVHWDAPAGSVECSRWREGSERPGGRPVWRVRRLRTMARHADSNWSSPELAAASILKALASFGAIR